ncbi:hypothetical protein [Mesorhizobium sangaii]|uniref:Uncharacterized protein n=1 Tax=Mesorhizobium sangaii TaxID=505389 RepID=A0A841PUV6_9HYPH|nr:hypothetical protein [Mesorhizobium sangaii]MBB6413832.1 hypothetical protein [Mesorhizobium sangaii]
MGNEIECRAETYVNQVEQLFRNAGYFVPLDHLAVVIGLVSRFTNPLKFVLEDGFVQRGAIQGARRGAFLLSPPIVHESALRFSPGS